MNLEVGDLKEGLINDEDIMIEMSKWREIYIR